MGGSIKRSLLATAILVGALTACSSPEPGPEARTYYESLDLSSPGAAAETFVEAFDDDDFMTVWFVLDHFAQREWRAAFDLFQLSDLVAYRDEMREDINNMTGTLVFEQADSWYVFDQLMLIADRHDALLVDLEPSSLTVRSIEADGGATVDGSFVGTEGTVTIRLNETPSGDWRVHQVLVPGGDPEQIPWSVP